MFEILAPRRALVSIREGKMIDKHMIERFLKDKDMFNFHHGNRWFINYNQLEPKIAKFIEENNYKIRRLKKSKS